MVIGLSHYLVVAAMLFTLGDDRGIVAAALSVPALIWLGERSYGIYMAHALVRMGYYHGHKLLTPVDTPLNETLWLIPYLIATVALAHWLHTRIELPVHRRVKAWIKAREQRRASFLLIKVRLPRLSFSA